MEYFDILNKDGSVSGRVSPKGVDLTGDDYYLGVHAYIYNSKGEFLIQKRAGTKEFLPNGWDIHMGHVMAGETGEAAILRELQEELGVNIEKVEFIKRIVWEKYNHFIDIFAACKDIDINEVILQEAEVAEVKYISKDEMLKLIRQMDYRPEEYRIVVENYVQEMIKL